MSKTLKEGGHFINVYDSLTFVNNDNPNVATEYIDPKLDVLTDDYIN